MHPKYSLFLFILLGGCICNSPSGYDHFTGRLPEEPQNFELINSRYNDYNSVSPIIHNEVFLLFSSDRESQGENYDLVGGNYFFEWSRDKGTLRTGEVSGEYWNNYTFLMRRINTEGNEYGPLSYQIDFYDSPSELPNDFLLFSSDTSGRQDIYLSYRHIEQGNETDSAVNLPLKGINSEADDMYPTFFGYKDDNFRTAQNEYTAKEMYFCSNKDGNFNIYKVGIPEGTGLPQFLLSEDEKTKLPVSFNSDANDKCPFIIKDVLLFVSDRAGGYGGFDIYYCLRDGDQWSEPKNLGPKINTEYNEYRPVSSVFWEYENDLVLFSSDRPGGMGGYDLYYAGTDKFRPE
jgi:hypothetical protein